MARYQFSAGSVFSYDEEHLKFLRLADDEEDTHVFQRPDGRAFEMASVDVQREMAAGRLCFVPAAQLKRPRRIDASTADESDEATGKWRNRFVTKWKEGGMPSLSVRKLQPVIEQTMREVDALPREHPDRLRRAPSPRTLMRWIRSCQNGHDVLSDLYPQTRLSGNSKPRISDDIGDILDDAIWGDYLTENQPSVHAVWKKMCEHIDGLNK